MSYEGDIRLGDTIDIKFFTQYGGAPTTLSGSPVISAYVGNSVTQITAGITLTADFDGLTGLNNVRVVATGGNGYATATNVTLVVTTGTISGFTAVGYIVGSFSIENRSAVMPTVAARTLDVSAGGEAGVDWANVGSPTTTVGLSGTTVKTATDIETKVDTIDNFLDTEIADIKAKTDSLTFTVAGQVDANIQRINDVAITGDGSGTPWDAA